MKTPFTAWFDACEESWKLWSMVAETASASSQVIAHRLPMMADAARWPFALPSAEMQRMVAEKPPAFADAAAAFGNGLNAAAQGQATLAGVWLDALRPIHAESTGNAKRLARRKGR